MIFKKLVVLLLASQCFVECTGKAGSPKGPKKQQSVSLEAKQKIAEYGLKRNDYVILISIPKCGTYLITKCLNLLDINDLYYPYNEAFDLEERMSKAIIDNQNIAPDYVRGAYDVSSAGKWPLGIMRSIKKSRGDYRFFRDHFPHTAEAEALFEQCCAGNFFIFRDPRDMIVSMAYFLHKGPGGLLADVNALIWDFIDGRKKSFIPWGVGINQGYPLLYDYGVTDFYKLYLGWMKARKFLAIKFEDLVGPQGGGALEAQLATIKRIVQHLGVKRSDENICNVAKNLFGESSTFREGKVGSWRKHFTREMIEAYKKVSGACQLLIDLGYEKDANW